MYRLIVKGSPDQALAEARFSRKLDARLIGQTAVDTTLEVDDGPDVAEVLQGWLGDTRHRCEKGTGYPAGALLFFKER